MTTGKLTTHVLDTAQGQPAPGMRLELWQLNPQTNEKQLLKSVVTNQDGRTEQPLLANHECITGVYELVFMVGEYFLQQDLSLPEPPFLNRVPIQFGIANPAAHYHVPLLVSPWAYSTYRGS